MPETFAQYLEKWLKQSTAQGLNNPLVKMPVKRFRLLRPTEFAAIANRGSLPIGAMSDPISRNLYKKCPNPYPGARRTRQRLPVSNGRYKTFQLAEWKTFG